MARKAAFWLAITLAAIILFLLYNLFGGSWTEVHQVLSYSELVKEVEQGRVKSVVITGDQLVGRRSDDQEFQSTLPPQQQSFIDTLMQHGVGILFFTDEPSGWANLIVYWLPTLVYIGVLIYFLRRIVQALRTSADKLDAALSQIAQLTKGER